MFKNVIVFNIAPGWSATPAQLEEALQAQRFVPCGATQEKSVGWLEPRGVLHGPLLESVGGQWVLKFMLETKAVPANVIRRTAQERAAHIEAATGRKPGKKELRDLKEEIKYDLLPMAFTKQSSVMVWIDARARLLVLDAGSTSRSDEVVTALVQVAPGIAPMLIHTATSPTVAMAGWLRTKESPQGFSIDRECVLQASDESKAVVRYSRHPLDIDEVCQHIDAGKLPTQLALTWQERVSFVLTEGLQLKKVSFLDVVMEGAESASNGSKDDHFDADVSIATTELRALWADLVVALDGEMALGAVAQQPAQGV